MRSQASSRWINIGLFALTLLSRLPFRSHILYHWDSVNFAYAMNEFSIAKEQPHPPGYILYVWLCRIVNLAFKDPQTTMVWISMVSGALSVVALYHLGKSMFNKPVGLIAAIFLTTSPLYWFYNEIALPHSLDLLMVTVSAWWLYETTQGNDKFLYPAMIILAIAGGMRPQTLVFLALLILFSLRKVGWTRFFLAGALGAAICLMWFIPLVNLNGGLASYMQVIGEFSDRFQSTTSILIGGGWWGIKRNARKLAMYTLYGWSIAIIPSLVYAVHWFKKHKGKHQWEKAFFLLIWAAPAGLYYLLIHMGQQGLVFVFLPALLLLSAASLHQLLKARHTMLIITTSAILLANLGIFTLGPEYPTSSDTPRLLTRATLANSDRYYESRFEAIKQNFLPESTALLAANWHHVEYYLPDYALIPVNVASKWEPEAHQINDAEGTWFTAQDLDLTYNADNQMNILIFDDKLSLFNQSQDLTQILKLDDGEQIEFFTLSPNQALYLDQIYRVGELGNPE